MSKNNPFDKSRCKLAAFDLDGTILDEGILSPRSREALWALHQSGIEVVLSTGRHYRMIPSDVRDLPFIRYAITSNGAHVLDLQDGSDISLTPFARRTAILLTNCFLESARVTHIFCRDKVLMSWKDLWKLRKYLRINPIRRRRNEFFRWVQIVFFPNLNLRNPKNRVCKFNVLFEDKAACDAMLNRIRREFAIEAISTGGRDIEATPVGISKGFGLHKLCEHLDIESEETVAFGDSTNDIAIMQCCGYAVAMGNACDEVKVIADYIAPHVSEDGAAHAMTVLFT